MNNDLLEVQKYLMQGKSLEDLKSELDIDATHHDTLPLVILNYGKGFMNKTHPIVRECRALVLEKGTWSLVARSFKRFFNWGEIPEEDKKFNFTYAKGMNKEDGSLIMVWYYQGQWMMNTKSTFGEGQICENGPTWKFLTWALLDFNKLARHLTYVYELCSPWNKIVRDYPTSRLKLIGLFCGHEDISHTLPGYRYYFQSIDDVYDLIQERSSEDPTWEGVVICDANFNRIKVKNPKYLDLHKLKGNNGHFKTEILLEKIMEGDEEFLVYMPEIKETYEKMKRLYLAYLNEVETLWYTHGFPGVHLSQKEFALKVKHHPLSNILFRARKEGKSIKDVWYESKDLIGKYL